MPLNRLSPAEIIQRLLALSGKEQVCIADSCGIGGGQLIAGVGPRFSERISGQDADTLLSRFEDALASSPASFFTLSYDLGLKLHGIPSRHDPFAEPDIFIAGFDSLLVHDYATGRTVVEGDTSGESGIASRIDASLPMEEASRVSVVSEEREMSREEYVSGVEAVRELIRDGETYQANLTQKFRVPADSADAARRAFLSLRMEHPAAYTAFLDRGADTVVSTSPERFFRIDALESDRGGHIETAPIKGTRRRTGNEIEDALRRDDLLASPKDRAENIMITDLLRNDLGRVCEYGSVKVGELCALDVLPSLFHLVSTVNGRLREGVSFSDVVRALFPCGSITGAPKHRTMEIIDKLEPSSRGLSMGAIGLSISNETFPFLRRARQIPAPGRHFDLSVAIRTMVVRDGSAVFNTGGGIVIDSEPEAEYEESLDKATAILRALGAGAFPRSRSSPGTLQA